MGQVTESPFEEEAVTSTAAEDPEVSLGEFAREVRVGLGAWLPRQPALYPAKKKWSLEQQYDGERPSHDG